MSIAGASLIAIWNDVTDEGRENFYQWHNREHMPERVGITGFLRGRRWIAISGEPEYFTLYEVRDNAVLAGKDYLERLNSPTEWTKRSIKDFLNVARSLCNVDFSAGKGSGGIMATLRFDCEPEKDAALMKYLKAACEVLIEAPGMVGVHICRADISASNVKTEEKKGRPDPLVPRWVILLESSTPEAVDAALSGSLSQKAFAGAGIPNANPSVYRLENDLVSASR